MHAAAVVLVFGGYWLYSKRPRKHKFVTRYSSVGSERTPDKGEAVDSISTTGTI